MSFLFLTILILSEGTRTNFLAQKETIFLLDTMGTHVPRVMEHTIIWDSAGVRPYRVVLCTTFFLLKMYKVSRWISVLTSTSCSPLWRISDDFNAPKVKSISQIH